ncbi:T9SS type A sorting domain-containing protein [Hymenobacter sp. BT559]|uniref:T9SS type A sorting domain-containing protein n=1 Tax=Hymenobacter sp. BT559 TaxID=2795729 RepID=UPI0018EE0B44|nr:T9SS type A sorting domain-containing protein [Hymenobacter sp. BT559]MBJ6143770.1 T9SS type A sorting domain-containing protein [Hymenobacter sp. BT559]
MEGCTFSGAGDLIRAGEGANLTVRNCTGQGLTPTVDGQARGRFLDTYRAKSLTIEHNSFTQTSGIVVNRWSGSGQSGQTLTVRYNRVRNIDGRWRNGGSTRSSFLILNTVTRVPGIDISYNEVINTANESLVEDNINLYNSSGTAQSSIRIHDNFVRGAYPFPATSAKFTGTGLTTDGDASTLAEAAGYIEADNNQFVGTANAAMNIAAGHDIYYHDNRLVTSGYLPNGQRLNAGWAALGVFNYYKQPASVYFNNRIQNNTIGYVSWNSNFPYTDRLDLSPGACGPCTGTVHLPNPITTATEDAEATRWQAKLQQAGVTVGPVNSTTPPVVTVPVGNGTVVNPSFEQDGAGVDAPAGWLTWVGNGTPASVDYTEAYGGAHSGTYHGTHWRNTGAYEVYTYQTLTGLANGTYSFSAWVKSSGGQPAAQLWAKNFGAGTLSTDITATNGSWVQVSVNNICVTNGQCEIGFYSKAKSDQFIYFDDVEFTQQTTSNKAPTVTLAATSNLVLGKALTLNATAADADGTVSKVEFFNGSTSIGTATSAPFQLNWTPSFIGLYSLTARATDNSGATTSSAAVPVLVVIPSLGSNQGSSNGSALVVNPSFEQDGAEVDAPAGWLTWVGNGTPASVDYTEAYGGAHSGTYHGTHWRNTGAYEVYTYQTLTGLANGTYSFSAWVKSSGGQPAAQLWAKNFGAGTLSTDITATNGSWVQVSVNNIRVTNGQCEIGFYSKAKSDQFIYFDDVEFAQQTTQQPSLVTTNSVGNFSFEDDNAGVVAPRQWLTRTGGTTQAYASYSESYPNARTGTYHGTHYRPENYQIYTYQTVTGLANGTYTLSAWVKSTGGQRVAQLQAQNYGGSVLSANVPTSPNEWVQITIPSVNVTNGQLEVGIYSQANGGQWLHFDDITLLPTTASSAKSAPVASEASVVPALYPNPARDQVMLTTQVAQESTVSIVITDLQGNTLITYQRKAVAGENQFTLDTNKLEDGLYILRVLGSSATSAQRLEIKH